jgi:hypothetical protein
MCVFVFVIGKYAGYIRSIVRVCTQHALTARDTTSAYICGCHAPRRGFWFNTLQLARARVAQVRAGMQTTHIPFNIPHIHILDETMNTYLYGIYISDGTAKILLGLQPEHR